jgi:prepilin-type N-terminal cleavage/methylation domain-containing protein
MSKKGVTIFEMLAALVIFAIIATLLSSLIRTMTIASERISEEAKANVQATLLIAKLNSYFDDFKPTDYSTDCEEDTCIVIIKSFEYYFNEVTNTITLEVFDPPVESIISFQNNNLFFDDLIYELDGFVFNDFSLDSSINDNNDITIRIDFTLGSNDSSYNFSMTYSYDFLMIPIT